MQNTEELKKKFLELQTRQDVADILEIKESSLRYFLYGVRPDNMYTDFTIKKKNGGVRRISAPAKQLRTLQRKLATILNVVYKPKQAAHGFVVDKSIKTNASTHTGRKYVFNIDLKDFFDQINFGRVRAMLMKPPYGIGAEAALVIAQLACYNSKLPQGAPTSPILTNMICSPMDTHLTRLAEKYHIRYTRYADDITFSSYKNEFAEAIMYYYDGVVKVGKELESIIKADGFIINYDKVRMSDFREREEVTGLVVNKFVNVRRSYIKEIRAILFHCENEGIYQAARSYIEKGKCKSAAITSLIRKEDDYSKKRITEWFKSVLKGKIEYVGSIRGKNDNVFKKYAKEVNQIFEEELFKIEEHKKLVDRAELSVFILSLDSDKEDVQGTGFILKDIGMLTNYHVTEQDGSYLVATYTGERVTAVSNEINLIKRNKEIDYACYGFGRKSENAWDCGDSSNLDIGSKVTMISFPDYVKGNSPEIQYVRIIARRKAFGKKIYTVSGRIVHGASGGVVLDESEKVVGMIRCGSETIDETNSSANQGFIPINEILGDILPKGE